MHPCDNLEALLRTLQPPRRNSYFYGKRMDVQHFQMEQDYGKHKQWLLNRLTHGKGVLCGLRVSLDGTRICVDPGVAIDGLGREIIVPHLACIDPITQEGGCCGDPCCSGHGATPEPPRDERPPTDNPDGGVPGRPDSNVPGRPDTPGAGPQPGSRPQVAAGLYTLWLCYRECKADYQPVLVSDCGTREQCAAGTIVETYCLKMTPGLPPLQGDPEWCAKLWPKPAETEPETPGGVRPAPGGLSAAVRADLNLTAAAPNRDAANNNLPTEEQVAAAMASRRRILCELFSGNCDPAESDPCVPLAALLLRDNRIVRFDSCLVRPRVYSNAVLLDLILCLADKIEECCGHGDTPPQPATLMRVRSVEFLGGANNQDVIAAVESTETLQVPIGRQGNAIRIRFTQPFDQAANAPSTPGLNDPDWKRHNVVVLPDGGPRFGLDYAPGSLTVEAPDTLVWQLNKESPFWARQHQGWQKGQLRLVVHGDSDAAAGRHAMTDTAGKALDGEPIMPAGGAISGNGTPGGTFTSIFIVG